MCPYFPFSARVCLNQHHWLATRMRKEGIDLQPSTSAFLRCGNPARLQELADSQTARDLLRFGQKWLATFTPFMSDKERKQAGCQALLGEFFDRCPAMKDEVVAILHLREEQTMRLPRNVAITPMAPRCTSPLKFS